MHYFVSDGSNVIFEGEFTKDENNNHEFKIIKEHSFSQLDKNGVHVPLKNINELEFVQGKIWANVWLTNDVCVLDMHQDKVVRKFDFKHITELENNYRSTEQILATGRDEVLNGIAYNPILKTLLLTGKNWNFVYELLILDDN